jgi:hypothetical protein
VNDRGLYFVEVLESRHDLHHNGPRFPFRDCLMLLQVEVKVVSITILKDSAERVGVNLKHIIQLDNPRMVQRLVNVVFSQSMSREKFPGLKMLVYVLER